MARSEMRENDAGKANANGVPEDAAAKAAERAGARPKDLGRPGQRIGSSRVSRGERDRMVKDAREIDFPIAMRGYDRAAVARYVEKVNRLIAELEMSSSPEAAIRHALDEVSDETRELLQRAHETAEDITARSRSRADDRLAVAEREAGELRAAAQQEAEQTREAATREAQQVRESAAQAAEELRESARREAAELRETASRDGQQDRAAAQRDADELRGSARAQSEEMLETAETRSRELTRSAETIWRERRRLIEDMRAVGDQLVAIGEAEAKRFPRFPDEAEPPSELTIDREAIAAPEVAHT